MFTWFAYVTTPICAVFSDLLFDEAPGVLFEHCLGLQRLTNKMYQYGQWLGNKEISIREIVYLEDHPTVGAVDPHHLIHNWARHPANMTGPVGSQIYGSSVRTKDQYWGMYTFAKHRTDTLSPFYPAPIFAVCRRNKNYEYFHSWQMEALKIIAFR